MNFNKKTNIFIILLLLIIIFIGWSFFNKKIKQKPIAKNNIETKRNIASISNKNKVEKVQNHNLDEHIPVINDNLADELDTETSFEPVIEDQPKLVQTEDEPQYDPPIKENTVLVTDELLTPPTSNTNELFNFNNPQNKYPVYLKWSEVRGADYYEVEIRKPNQLKRTYFPAAKNNLHIMIYSDIQYQWRVLAYKNNKRLTLYSDKFNLMANLDDANNNISRADETVSDATEEIAENEEPIDEALDDTNYSENLAVSDMPELDTAKMSNEKNIESRVPASFTGDQIPLWSRFWLNIGAGVNSNLNSQSLNDTLNFDYHSLATPSYSGALGIYLTNNIALEATYQNTTDTLEEINDILIDQDYNLINYGVEGIYSFGRGLKSKDSNWYLRLGAKSNDIPILEAYPISKDVKLLSGNFLSGSLGLGRRTSHSKNWRSDFYINYLHTFSSKTDTSEYILNGSLMFESYFGLNYQLFNNLHLGFFWQGQFISLDYGVSNQSESVEAVQTFINNKLGLFLGLEF